MSKRGPSATVYLAVFAALLALTAVTVAVSMVDLRWLNTPVALGIAGLKAGLVGLYFMHLRYSSRLTWIFAAAALCWLTILLVLTLSDYATRGWPPAGR